MISVFDIGGRYGIHPNWVEPFKKGLVDYQAFEIDKVEVERLAEKYSSFDNYSVHNVGFSDTSEILTMNILEHRGQSSFLTPNLDSTWFQVHRNEDAKVNHQIEYQLTTLYKHTKQTQIFPDFLKIDTEGMDLKVLKGSLGIDEALSGTMLEGVLAISCEVYFEEVFEHTPLFGEIHLFLINHGFKLANLSYDGKGIPSSYFCPSPMYFGIISGGEATFIKPFEGLSVQAKQKLALF
jgi:FkbM family methyltransferase